MKNLWNHLPMAFKTIIGGVALIILSIFVGTWSIPLMIFLMGVAIIIISIVIAVMIEDGIINLEEPK